MSEWTLLIQFPILGSVCQIEEPSKSILCLTWCILDYEKIYFVLKYLEHLEPFHMNHVFQLFNHSALF